MSILIHDRSMMREFYFSKAKTLKAFSRCREHEKNHSADKLESRAVRNEAASPSPETLPVVGIKSVHGQKDESWIDCEVGKGLNDTKLLLKSLQTKNENISANYLAYLDLEHSLCGVHNDAQELLSQLEQSQQQVYKTIDEITTKSYQIFNELLENKDWKLKSKYDTETCAKDCSLNVPCNAFLSNETKCDVQPMQVHIAHLNSIKSQYNEQNNWKFYDVAINRAVRRLRCVEEELSQSNLPDSAFCVDILRPIEEHLQESLSERSCAEVLSEYEIEIRKLDGKVTSLCAQHSRALQNGEVSFAEECMLEIIDGREKLLSCIQGKISLLENQSRAYDRFSSKLESDHCERVRHVLEQQEKFEQHRDSCAIDLSNLLCVRDKIEHFEQQANTKSEEENRAIENFLRCNQKDLYEAIAHLESAVQRIQTLEITRHKELRRYIRRKEAEERRKAEYLQFNKVADELTNRLENTIQNQNVALHCLQLVQHVCDFMSEPLTHNLNHKCEINRKLLTLGHEQHIQVYQELFMTMGELMYRKQRALEETQDSMERAVEQQELCMGAFDPNAKRFHLVKLNLLQRCAELKKNIDELNQRLEHMEESCATSVEYLKREGKQIKQPREDFEAFVLAYKSKMLSYKALIEGHSSLETIRPMHQILQQMGMLAQTEGHVGVCPPSSGMFTPLKQSLEIVQKLSRSVPEIS